MATRGYNRYRGRSGGGHTVWVIVLVLILLAAVAFLISQRYLVYDGEGQPHLELPFGREARQENEPPENPISPEDVVIERQEPEETPVEEASPAEETPPAPRTMTPLHAREVEYGALWWAPDYVMSQIEESLMVEIKRTGGGITFGTAVEVPADVVVERGVTRDNLVKLLQSGRYSVARINCFWDGAFAEAVPEAALRAASGQLWADAAGRNWLDPGHETTRSYLTALCRECGELGFREILLDGFCYPSSGDLAALALPEGLDRTAALTDFAAALRAAVPEGVAVSVALRGEMGGLDGSSGLTAALLDSFDRIYVDGSVDREALMKALPEGFDQEGRLVLLTNAKQETGSYVIMP